MEEIEKTIVTGDKEQIELYVEESWYEKPENVVLSAELMKQFEKERENIQKQFLQNRI